MSVPIIVEIRTGYFTYKSEPLCIYNGEWWIFDTWFIYQYLISIQFE